MPKRKNIEKRRNTGDYATAAGALANQGMDPMEMAGQGEGTPGMGLSTELIQRLAHMQQQGRLTTEELKKILMARASLPEVLGG